MQIRRLDRTDATAFHALRLQALAEAPTAFSASLEEECELTLPQREAFLAGSAERQVFGSFSDGALTGMVGLGREAGLKLRHKGFIRSVYVVPGHRRSGLARRLLRHALEVAGSWSGLRQLSLLVAADNAGALALYRSMGFTPAWTERDALFVQGHWHDEVQMVRRLHLGIEADGQGIRPFLETDREAVIRLWQRCGLLRPWNDPQRDIDRKQQVQPELFIVGVASREVVASAMAGWDGHRGWVNYLAVDEAHRRQGWGRRLMTHIEQELARRGCPKLNLQVRRENAVALSFYEPLGYADDQVIGLGKRLIPDLAGP